MGVVWSDCLPDISHATGSPRYGRLPPPRRLASSSSSTSSSSKPSTPSTAQSPPPPLRQRCVCDEKQAATRPSLSTTTTTTTTTTTKTSAIAASHGAAASAPPPPLIPDAGAIYDLLDDETEDVCPTCLEPYTSDNPKITSSCGHSFHLQCIMAWEIRSSARFCPICAKVMHYVEA